MTSHEHRYNRLAQAFRLPPQTIETQYHLALKNRLEIPPLLMRRLIDDARSILRLMIKEIDREDHQENDKRLEHIQIRLAELETYHKLFNQHC